MLIAITDACIFIDLIELKITSHFFNLNIEVHTTYDVWNELFDEQQKTLKGYQDIGKLTVHILEEEEINEILDLNYPKSLSSTDKSVLYIARKINAVLLSSDKAVRNTAKTRAIKYHGLLWIFDELVSNNDLSKIDATSKLKELFQNNLMYRGNVQLTAEADKRYKLWEE